MAITLEQQLESVRRKSRILIEKYNAIVVSKNLVNEKNLALEAENERLRKENELLKRDNNYLKIARSVAGTSGEIEDCRRILSKLIRDVDKCISQLND